MTEILRSIVALHDRMRRLQEAPSAYGMHCLAQAETQNAGGHIYTQLLPARVREQGRRLDAMEAGSAAMPLLGVPLAVKDNIDMAGVWTSGGGGLADREPARRDAPVVARLEAAGAVTLGKTNLDAAALGASGRNALFGRCINPHNAASLSGGSSSGSAAAVAAGHCLLGIGTDTLGSVRIPAAFCGVIGFKPSAGLLPTTGVLPLYPRFDVVGLLANGIDDIERALTVLMTESPAPAATGNAPLRLACLGEAALVDSAPEVVTVYRAALARLRAAVGVTLHELAPLDFDAVARAAFQEVAGHFARQPAGMLLADGGETGAGISADLQRTLAWARRLGAVELQTGRQLLEQASASWIAGLGRCDALLTPTCPMTAVGTQSPVPASIARFVSIANVTGAPAIAWPVHDRESMHSASLQLIGHPYSDRRLLSVTAEVQRLLA